MPRTRRLLTFAAAAALATSGVLAAASAPASASPTCRADGCLGHDPDRYHCASSSVTTASAYLGSTKLATLWNKYSVACVANWSSAQLTPAAISAGDRLYVSITTDDHLGHLEYTCYPDLDDTGTDENCTNYPYSGYGGSGFPYTDMVDGTETTYSQVTVVGPDGSVLGIGRVTQ